MAQVEAVAQAEPKQLAPGEIRVSSIGVVSSYVAYAKKLIAAGEPVIHIRGTGRAMSNVVETAEILKRVYKGMHQVATLDTQENLVAAVGEDGKEQRRSVCFLTITLTMDPSKIDTTAVGYQKPLTDEQLGEVEVDKLIQALKTSGIRKKGTLPRKPRGTVQNAENGKKN
ncbi:Alba-like protein C9orf23 homolog [Babesia bigemina]|uniref:Alba-like protein C9orf23 homolog n=1 Tax=Babesia bigemina TaxID=5866 RepID=A0A061D8X5_BABBI|nr:Alba-like protein C9orf23 homolog [Babesia bigemina]CDR96422.1 Alba-like protein C9orf23 homolog [Babesia bigemina]|eukprot:XP_012768608.1 Alba-like protein C9orf23 homolog [Babesia bigemina]